MSTTETLKRKKITTKTATKIGIEYAHIYTDQQFSRQHERGLGELKSFLASGLRNKPARKVVLVDDYSTEVSLEDFNLTAFLDKLAENDATPDTVVFESSLIKYCKLTLGLIADKKLKRRLDNYIKTKQKYPCSLFGAAWYLLQLGVFGRPNVVSLLGAADNLIVDKIVTILPDSFTTPEQQAMDIIRTTPYADLTERIQHIMFEHQESEYSDWQLFDADEYSERNYGRTILPEDKQIIRFVITALNELHLPPHSLKKVADICAGPNLYPALLMSPFLAPDSELRLIDFAQPNLDYLTRVLGGKDTTEREKWAKFEEFMTELGHSPDMQLIKQVASIEKGSIFEQPTTAIYDGVLSFFGAESITDSEETFDEATASLMATLKPNGLFIIAHMVGSHGYFAGERTFFPAVNLSIEDIRVKYGNFGQFKSYVVTHGIQQAARKGYTGMAVVVGRKTV